MSNLTQDTIFPARGDGVLAEKLANGVTIYGGSLLARTVATGLLAKLADSAGLVFVGQALRGLVGDGSKEAGYASGHILQNVNVTGVTDRTSQGAKVYVSTDNPEDFTLTPTTHLRAVGRIMRWRSAARCDVKLFTEEQYAAQVLIADLTTLTDSSGLSGTHDDTIAAMAAITTLTDSTGQSGTHDDTLAATAVPAALTENAGAIGGTNDGDLPTPVDPAGDAGASLIACVRELAARVNTLQTLLGVMTQNQSDVAQKVIELVTREQIAAQNISDLAQKQIEVITRLNAQQ